MKRLMIPTNNSIELNTAASRLLLNLMPGIWTFPFFKPTDSLITRLFNWAEKGTEPLQGYAVGLLAAAVSRLENVDIRFRELNALLVPLLLERLRQVPSSITTDATTFNYRKPFDTGKINFGT